MVIYQSIRSVLTIVFLTTFIVALSSESTWAVKITATKGKLSLCQDKYLAKGKVKCEHIKTVSADSTNAEEKKGSISEQIGGEVKATDGEAEFSYVCEEAKCGRSKRPCKGSILLKNQESIGMKQYQVCPRGGRTIGGFNESIDLPKKETLSSLQPYVVAPRYTLLLTDRPRFYLQVPEHLIQQSPLYTIALCKQFRGKIESVWTDSVSVPTGIKRVEYLYPKNLISLEKETSYRLVVKVRNTNNSESKSKQESCKENTLPNFEISRYPSKPRDQFPVSGLAFELINSETLRKNLCKEIQATEKHNPIRWNAKNEPDDSPSAYNLAKVYSKHHLSSDAIAVLELRDVRVGRSFQAPDAYLLLSEQYYEIGLDKLALDALNRAFVSASRAAIKNKAHYWKDDDWKAVITAIQTQCLSISKSLKRSGELLHTPYPYCGGQGGGLQGGVPLGQARFRLEQRSCTRQTTACQDIYKTNYQSTYGKEFHQGFPMIVMPAQKPGCENLQQSSSSLEGSNRIEKSLNRSKVVD